MDEIHEIQTTPETRAFPNSVRACGRVSNSSMKRSTNNRREDELLGRFATREENRDANRGGTRNPGIAAGSEKRALRIKRRERHGDKRGNRGTRSLASVSASVNCMFAVGFAVHPHCSRAAGPLHTSSYSYGAQPCVRGTCRLSPFKTLTPNTERASLSTRRDATRHRGFSVCCSDGRNYTSNFDRPIAFTAISQIYATTFVRLDCPHRPLRKIAFPRYKK